MQSKSKRKWIRKLGAVHDRCRDENKPLDGELVRPIQREMTAGKCARWGDICKTAKKINM